MPRRLADKGDSARVEADSRRGRLRRRLGPQARHRAPLGARAAAENLPLVHPRLTTFCIAIQLRPCWLTTTTSKHFPAACSKHGSPTGGCRPGTLTNGIFVKSMQATLLDISSGT